MRLLNNTPFAIATAFTVDPDARQRLVVIAKAAYAIPTAGGVPRLLPEPPQFVYSDEFLGSPGESSLTYESDFAPFKPQCDVLLLGSAHAPNGVPAARVQVAVRVGPMTKSFEVVGDRRWTRGVLGLSPSAPQPFTRMPIAYERAFGGDSFLDNPVGCGDKTSIRLEQPVPNTQELGKPITSARGKHRPMSFGPVGRNFADRLRHAGTYDDDWKTHTFPLLPRDFTWAYFQSAPPDQQIPHPKGGERVQLLNLTPTPVAPFELPTVRFPVCFVLVSGDERLLDPVLDMIIFEPDLGRMQLIWRTSMPLLGGPSDVVEIAVGGMPPGWRRARRMGKPYFASLAEAIEVLDGGSA